MSLPKVWLLAAGMIMGACAGAQAQLDRNEKPFDFKPLVPPLFPLPPNAQVQSGSVGGSHTPTTTAPLQNPTQQSPTQPAPGIRLNVPTR